MSKNPERSEYRKFGGKCNWCWRVGHKEEQRWFKKAYAEHQGAGWQKANKHIDQKADENKKITQYFKKKAPEGDAMDTNAVWEQESKEVYTYAIWEQEPEDITTFIEAVLSGDCGEQNQGWHDGWGAAGPDGQQDSAEEQRAHWKKMLENGETIKDL